MYKKISISDTFLLDQTIINVSKIIFVSDTTNKEKIYKRGKSFLEDLNSNL